jgi:hypothetical protein
MIEPDGLTLAEAARIMREAMRDEGWEQLPLGEDIADIYTDWDEDRLAASLEIALEEEG